MKIFRNILLASTLAMGGWGMTSVAAEAHHGIQHEVTASNISIKVAHGQIELTVTGQNAPVKFQIYSITGQLVKTTTVTDGTSIVELPRGLYVVRCDRWSKQVVVK